MTHNIRELDPKWVAGVDASEAVHGFHITKNGRIFGHNAIFLAVE